ncbi:MAG: hypothetical protein AAGA30_15710 [Planctomycetota bacterium]
MTGRAFVGGEEYISLLLDDEGELIRQDIALEQWESPPDNCVGWWKSKVPDLEKGRVYWAPKDVLMTYFTHLREASHDNETTYVMAILLLQKKHLRLLDNETHDGHSKMLVACNTTREKFEVNVIDISDQRIAQIQNDLAEKLFTDIPPNEE